MIWNPMQILLVILSKNVNNYWKNHLFIFSYFYLSNGACPIITKCDKVAFGLRMPRFHHIEDPVFLGLCNFFDFCGDFFDSFDFLDFEFQRTPVNAIAVRPNPLPPFQSGQNRLLPFKDILVRAKPACPLQASSISLKLTPSCTSYSS
jgi:hypothetical protein